MSELGIIGATYEDRRNGRIGKLISRDEKCKTLMFEAPEGKNFITSYSGFRSNMRKKDIEISAESSNDVPETVPTETEIVQENTEKPVKKAKKEKTDDSLFESSVEMYTDMLSKVSNYVDTFKNKRLKIFSRPEKRMVGIVADKRGHVVDFGSIFRDSQVKMFITEEDYLNRKWTADIDAVYKHVTYSKPMCVYVSYTQFETLLEDIRPIIVDLLVKKSNRRNVKEEL